jgi:hypothetical protein
MSKSYLIILDDSQLDQMVYLGELEPGIRQGTKRDNAVRFTRVGAYRVAAQYPTACRGAGARIVQESK